MMVNDLTTSSATTAFLAPHPHPSYDTSVRPRVVRPLRWETTAPRPWAAASGTWHHRRWKGRSRR